MQAMRTALRLKPGRLLDATPTEDEIPATLHILAAPDHLPLLRRVAHEAEKRLMVMYHRMGSPMIQNVFDPAQVASERIETVQALYSIPSGKVKKRDVRAAGEMGGGRTELRKIQSQGAMLHGKALLWDHDDIVVTSFDWGAQTASENKSLDEIGLHLKGDGIAGRGGSVCLNSSRAFSKWFSASVTPPPLRVPAGGNRLDRGFFRQAMNVGVGCCRRSDTGRSRSGPPRRWRRLAGRRPRI